jgi:catechol 2,3-dioxygenase-like lactoylglutathione lyase family enzyme
MREFLIILFYCFFLFLEISSFGISERMAKTIQKQLRKSISSRMTLPSHRDSAEVPSCLPIHHTAVKTRNITLAIQFYGLLGFELTTKFRAGPARAAWLEQKGQGTTRLELIEVPSHILNEPEGMKRRALNFMDRQDFLGLNHLALDVSGSIKQKQLVSLSDWLDNLNEKSLKVFGKTVRIALKPQQQLIGRGVYELAFLYDADGVLIELLNKQKDLSQEIDSGWEPWDGQEFSGKSS